MSKKEKPLPKPPKTPFGRKKRFEDHEEDAPLLADQMSMAMAKGKLEEFMQEEMPDNEHAKKLAEMMMQMSGMAPQSSLKSKVKKEETPTGKSTGKKGKSEEKEAPAVPPEDIMKAVQGGNVNDLIGLLKREHEKQHPDSGSKAPETAKPDHPGGLSEEEKKVLDQLVNIASENRVSMDWLTLRALKLYVQEYKKTGKL